MRIAYEIIDTKTNAVVTTVFYKSAAELGIEKLNSVYDGRYICRTIFVDNNNNKIDISNDWWE